MSAHSSSSSNSNSSSSKKSPLHSPRSPKSKTKGKAKGKSSKGKTKGKSPTKGKGKEKYVENDLFLSLPQELQFRIGKETMQTAKNLKRAYGKEYDYFNQIYEEACKDAKRFIEYVIVLYLKVPGMMFSLEMLSPEDEEDEGLENIYLISEYVDYYAEKLCTDLPKLRKNANRLIRWFNDNEKKNPDMIWSKLFQFVRDIEIYFPPTFRLDVEAEYIFYALFLAFVMGIPYERQTLQSLSSAHPIFGYIGAVYNADDFEE